MEQGKVHIDQLYRDSPPQLHQLPPAAWEDMKRRLDEGKPGGMTPYPWKWFIALIVLLIPAGVYLLKSHPGKHGYPAVKKIALHAAPAPEYRVAPPSDAVVPPTKPPFVIAAVSSGKALRMPADHGSPASKAPMADTPRIPVLRKQPAKEHPYADRLPGALRPPPARSNGSQATAPDGDLCSVRVIPPPDAVSVPSRPAMPVNPMPAGTRDMPSGMTEIVPPPAPAPVPAPAAPPIAARAIQRKSIITPLPQVAPPTQADMIQTLPEPAIAATPVGPEPTRDSISSRKKRGLPGQVSVGVRAGYETGFSGASVQKAVAGLYVQYRIGSRVSVSLQPAIKYGAAGSNQLPDANSYYSPMGITVDTEVIIKNGHPFNRYTFTNTYDSIRVSYQVSSNSPEVEVPLLLLYHFPNGLSLGGGVSITLGKLFTIAEKRQTVNQRQTAVFEIEQAGTHPPPDTSGAFRHTALPYSAYTALDLSAQSPVRTGYVLCMDYDRRKWDLELSLRQTLSGLSRISVPGVRDAYRLPYLRLMVGYRLGKK